MNRDARLRLFEENVAWAKRLAAAVYRRLPPSFELADLEQTAQTALWEYVQRYDPANAAGVPFQGYAYNFIRGTVLMSVRRRHYTDSTNDELYDVHRDPSGSIEDRLRAEAERKRDHRELDRQRREVLKLLPELGAVDAYLLRATLEGANPKDLAITWGMTTDEIGKRLTRATTAVRRLRRAKAKE